MTPGASFLIDRGVIQGCAFASGLFATALSRTLKAGLPGVLIAPPAGSPDADYDLRGQYMVAYADDLHVASRDNATLAATYRDISRIIGTLGLAMAPGKSRLMMGEDNEVPGDLINALTPCLDVLGAPIAPPGAEVLEANRVGEALAEIRPIIASIAELPDPQHVVRALSLAGAWSRAEHIVSLASRLPADALAELEEAEAQALKAALGQWACELDPVAWAIATLPTRYGGLGLRSPTAEARGHARLTARRIELLETGQSVALGIHRIGVKGAADARHSVTLGALATVLPDTDLARLRLAPADRGGLVFEIDAAYHAGTLLAPNVANALIALALALPPLGKNVSHACGSLCHVPADDNDLDYTVIGDDTEKSLHHVLTCKSLYTTRHTAIVRAIASHASDLRNTNARLWVECDVDTTGAPIPPASRDKRPGDVAYRVGNGYVFVDVTVATPYAAVAGIAGSTRTGAPLPKASDMVMTALRRKYTEENAKRVQAARAEYKPIAFTGYGGIGKRAMRHQGHDGRLRG